MKEHPDDVLLAHTFAMILASTAQMQKPEDVAELLKELQVTLENPNTNHMIIVECGMNLWLKLFERQDINESMMQEEMRNRGLPMTQAYLNGLANGAFSLLMLEPFFMQSLSQVRRGSNETKRYTYADICLYNILLY